MPKAVIKQFLSGAILGYASYVRGERIEGRYLPLLRAYSRSRLDRPSFLTLTVKNICNLKVGFDKLKKAVRKFRMALYVRNRIKGGLYAYEVKVDKKGRYNLHAHFIILHRWFGSPPAEK